MSTMIKSVVAGLGLLTVAAVAHAQSVATLPPQAAPQPSVAPGMAVATPAPSPNYIGPAPGGVNAPKYEAFAKPTNWEQDTSAHPYTSGMGPRPN